MPLASTVLETDIPTLQLIHRGKVRDVYDAGHERLLIAATDRISAFDCVLPTAIKHKGVVLNQLSSFWFSRLGHLARHHLITTNFEEFPDAIKKFEELRGRSMLVKKTKPFAVECVVRGYLEGSGWKDYQATGSICGHRLPPGLKQCDKLPEPIFTPATKAVTGHDENITGLEFVKIVGGETAARLSSLSLKIYKEATEYALEHGIIIADTKFEFGLDENERILLIDEVLTPDSSRFWSAANYEPGQAQASFDKQFVREYLETLEWDKRPPAPPLPPEIAEATTERYLQAYKLLTGNKIVN